jgi:transcriptional regulator with XRE-family HTH domain
MAERVYHLCKYNRFIVNPRKLTDARLAVNKSLEDVATFIGCNKSSVSRWETGKLIPSESRIFLLTELYGTREFITANPDFKARSNKKWSRRKKKVEGVTSENTGD